MRTAAAKQYGMPSLTCRLLDQFHSDTRDMLVGGVIAFPEGREVRIYAKTKTVFGDLPALSEMISAKGLGGNLLCACCQNASNIKGGNPLHKKGRIIVSLSQSQTSRNSKYTPTRPCAMSLFDCKNSSRNERIWLLVELRA